MQSVESQKLYDQGNMLQLKSYRYHENKTSSFVALMPHFSFIFFYLVRDLLKNIVQPNFDYSR